MIDVSVTPGELVAGRTSPVALTFANHGRGLCADVVFKLKLPPGLVLMGGADRVDIALLPAGRTHTHQLMVKVRQPGRYPLTSANFAYRDEFDRPVRVTDFQASLLATAAPRREPIKQPSGSPRVWCERDELELDAWENLPVMLTNTTGVPLVDVTVTVSGPLRGNGKQARIATLKPGATARAQLSVRATEGGPHVPVEVRTSYGHLDPAGATRTRVQQDTVHLVVRPAASTGPRERTILYLAASPRDLAPLRSDLEMRKVMDRLQLSQLRDRYRLEYRPAARFADISQALMDHQPYILHFSGHGDRDGNLCVEDERGCGDLLTPEGLADLFGQHRATLRCVVLNACYTRRLAEAIVVNIDHVIGMRNRIGDEAAIDFSEGFYLGLFGGMTVPEAFQRGRSHLRSRLATEAQYLTPVLFPPGE